MNFKRVTAFAQLSSHAIAWVASYVVEKPGIDLGKPSIAKPRAARQPGPIVVPS